jgi:hypothetical protein
LSHGCTEEDIIGCLFFHVRDELIAFAKRLRTFNITIRISDVDARDLAGMLQADISAGKLRAFDRIEVSNIIDVEYVGMKRVLADWGPLLNKDNKHAALVGVLLNWHVNEPRGTPYSASDAVRRETLHAVIQKEFPGADRQEMARVMGGGPNSPALMAVVGSLGMVHENSAAFQSYLRKQQVDKSARAVGLRMRTTHKIVASVRWSQ